MAKRKRYYGEEAEILSATELAKMKAGWSDAISRILTEGFEKAPAKPLAVVVE